MSKKILLAVLVFTMALTIVAPMTVFAGWIKENGDWYYENSDGTLATGWVKDGNTWYYMDPSTGAMKTGLVNDGGNWYYLNSSGAMQTGWIKHIEHMYFGDLIIWYYAKSNGVLVKGWQKINGTWYFFSKDDCKMYCLGIYEIDGKDYFFYPSGAMAIGWVKYSYWPDTREWIYAKSDGALAVGWEKISGVWYYFDTNGSMEQDSVRKIGNQLYAFDKSGAWISGTGWKYLNNGYGWIYTQNGTVVTGWKKINGLWYYFNLDNGYMATGNRLIDGKIEQFNSSGAWQGTRKTIGWVLIHDEDWYYVEDTNGTLAEGWRTINGVTYYFWPYDGHLCFDDGGHSSGMAYIDGQYYHFDETGALQTGWIYDWRLMGTYYADENGVLQTGWQTIDGNRYYFNTSTDLSPYMYRGGIYEIDGVDYEFDENGVCITE